MKFLAIHLGLGDAIAFADLAVRIADGEPMIFPCWGKNIVSVKSLFVDHPNIEVHAIRNDMDLLSSSLMAGKQWIGVGHYSRNPHIDRDGQDMVEWVYRTAGIDPATRFDSGLVSKAAKHVEQCGLVTPEDGVRIIAHQDGSRGFVIAHEYLIGDDRHLEYIKFDPHRSILRYALALERAAEVHCIDSSILHLVEQVQPTGKLFYHRYPRQHSENHRLRHDWLVL